MAALQVATDSNCVYDALNTRGPVEVALATICFAYFYLNGDRPCFQASALP